MRPSRHWNWQRRVPLSCWLLLFTGILYLTLFCTPLREGLAPLALEYWPVVTVNLAFLLMLHEGLKSGFSPTLRLLLVGFGVAYFAGYGLLVMLSGQELQKQREVMLQRNALVHVPFNPGIHALQFESGSENGDLAVRLVNGYEADNVYEVPSGDTSAGLWFHQFAQGVLCQRMREVQKHGRDVQVMVHDFVSNGASSRCVISSRTVHARDSFLVRTQRRSESSWIANREIVTYHVSAPSGERYELNTGSELVLDWYPMPAITCTDDRSDSSPPCWPGFLKRRKIPLSSDDAGADAEMKLLARSLGLMPRMTH